MGARAEDLDCEGEADSGPLRLCAVSRAHKPPEELIRFVAGPDGAIVPDLARRLPGRGVWVDATRQAVAAAVRQKAFARSLKRQVSVPADLADLVERLMARRLAEALSIANKAGLVVAGFAKVEELIAAGEGGRAASRGRCRSRRGGETRPQIQGLAGPDERPATHRSRIDGCRIELGHGAAKCDTCCSGRGRREPAAHRRGTALRRYRLGQEPGGGVPPQVNRTQDVHD